jgi:hypothetical protein
MTFGGWEINSDFPQPLLPGWTKLVISEQVLLFRESTRKSVVLDFDFSTLVSS